MEHALLTMQPVISSIEEGGITQMDPKLQQIVVLRRNGFINRPTASTASDELAVIAKVSNAIAWMGMTEVRLPVEIGKTKDGESIVTGRIPIALIEHIRTQPFVSSLKAPRPLKPVLGATIEAIQGKTPPAIMVGGGKGAIVGIVDFGCDFAHLNFITNNGKTRISKLWNQGGRPGIGTGEVSYGRLYERAEIDNALSQLGPNPYDILDYRPGPSAHGTHVMDIAAGNGNGTKQPGVAPEAEIMFVELDSSDIPSFGTDAVGKNFGDSVHLLEALKFVFDSAGDRPCVINLSLGTNGGPHDGTTLVEQGIDSLVSEQPNRAVVIAAANSFMHNIHASGEIESGVSHDLRWTIFENDRTENEMEIWYNHDGRLLVEIIDPLGNSAGTVQPGNSGRVKDNEGNVLLFVANRLNDPNNNDNMIGIYLKDGLQGTWTVRLTNQSSSKISFHAWIERDDAGQSNFAPPHNNSCTLGSISCGKLSITVGSYDAHRNNFPISFFSSAGPTRDGREKPEVSAPGHDVVAALSESTHETISFSGTSMAAPAVTGAIAVLLSEAHKLGMSLSVSDIRKILTESVQRNPPGVFWDNRYGVGRISLQEMLNYLITRFNKAEAPGKPMNGSETN